MESRLVYLMHFSLLGTDKDPLDQYHLTSWIRICIMNRVVPDTNLAGYRISGEIVNIDFFSKKYLVSDYPVIRPDTGHKKRPDIRCNPNHEI